MNSEEKFGYEQKKTLTYGMLIYGSDVGCFCVWYLFVYDVINKINKQPIVANLILF